MNTGANVTVMFGPDENPARFHVVVALSNGGTHEYELPADDAASAAQRASNDVARYTHPGDAVTDLQVRRLDNGGQ